MPVTNTDRFAALMAQFPNSGMTLTRRSRIAYPPHRSIMNEGKRISSSSSALADS
jgi:hypothetical protein